MTPHMHATGMHMVCLLPSLASHTSRLCPSPRQAHQLHGSRSCSFALTTSKSRLFRHRQRVVQAEMQLDNRELLVGDCLSLVSFCLYKQITAIILTPNFPGWLAPMHFNPTRFEEFLSFAITVCGTWVGAAWLVGGYKANATSGDTTACYDTIVTASFCVATCHRGACVVGVSPALAPNLPTALARVSFTWLVSQPVAAAQLVLVTAAEGRSLVGATNFASVLPLAARGPGEPFATAAGVLGLMALWRAFYTVYLDFWNIRTLHGSPVNRYQDMLHFVDALRSALFVSIAFCVVLQFLSSSLGEEGLEQLFSALRL